MFHRTIIAPALLICYWAMAISPLLRAQIAVDLGATVVSTGPAQLRLDWTRNTGAVTQQVYRRSKGSSSWGAAIPVDKTLATYTDTTLLAGAVYEYQIVQTTSSVTNYGYISAGINVPAVEGRGKILLLVDQTMATPLAPEIAQLQQDLAGDGWTVVRSDLARMAVDPSNTNVAAVGASRLAEVASVRSTIIAAYNADPTQVKHVYILGHLPVPYSGNTAYDGHTDHAGAWPSDSYYADPSGTWTDTSVNNTTPTDKRNWNVPGDGKFDQTTHPVSLTLGVGRVDLSGMTVFPGTGTSETDLLRRYLRKAHQYRYVQGPYANISRRALSIPWGSYALGLQVSVYGCLGRAAGTTDGPGGVYPGDSAAWFTWAENNPTKTYLIGFAQGAGSMTANNGGGSSTDFGQRPSRVVFTSLFGSYFGDWGYANDFLRAPLAGNATGDSLGLCCFWGCRPNWFMQSMAMGETLGYMGKASQNNISDYKPTDYSPWGAQSNLMGDPALRLYMVLPPQGLQATSSNGQVNLSWTASPESNVLGYWVYRAASSLWPFTRLTPTLLATPAYTDATATAGSAYTYMVRRIKLETTPGGTFQNPSQGVFATLTANSGTVAAPAGPSALQASVTDSTHINLTWTDNASDETGYRVERKTGAAGSFAVVGTLPPGSASYTDAGPLTVGTVLYYRVFATNAVGDSTPSGEAAVDGAVGAVQLLKESIVVSKAVGSVDIPIQRQGGSVGTIGISYTTVDGSAIKAVHYATTAGTLTWSDGDTAVKYIHVPFLGLSQPQQPHSFAVTISTPTGGASLTQRTSTVVAIPDASAPLGAPWQETIFGGLPHAPQSGQVGGEISSAVYYDGTWAGSYEIGHFLYQTISGDAVMTARVEAPVPLSGTYSPAVTAFLVRDIMGGTSRMASIKVPDDATGTRFYLRTVTWTAPSTSTPAASNGIRGPYWTRLRRAGDVFTGDISPDGVTWTNLGSGALASMPTTMYWGFFHTGTPSLVKSYHLAAFDHISIDYPVADIASFTASPGSSAGSVSLAWSAASRAAQYVVERSTVAGSGFAPIATVSAPVLAYVDGGLTAGTVYYYRVKAINPNYASNYSSVASSTPSLPSGLDGWRYSHFGSTTPIPGVSGDLDTPAHDGIPNLLKYALSLDPAVTYNAGSAVPQAQITSVSGTNYLTLSFAGGASDVVYRVEAANDPAGPWTAIYTSTLGTAPGTGVVQDTQPIDASHPRRFLRLRVTHP